MDMYEIREEEEEEEPRRPVSSSLISAGFIFTTVKIWNKNDNRATDAIDRLNCRYTTLFLILAGALSVVTLFKIHSATPVLCWSPPHFTISQTKYVESYCWTKNTYYVPWREEIPRQKEEKRYVTFYQWIPALLLFQALLFCLPDIFWRHVNSSGGIHCHDVIGAAKGADKLDSGDYKKRISNIVKMIHAFINSRQKKKCFRRRSAFRLSVFYVFIKLWYLINVLGITFSLNAILSTPGSFYGLQIVKFFMGDRENSWVKGSLNYFPRVTFCDVPIRRLGNIHRYTIQCSLPANLYNIKIFTFFYFWYIFIALANALSFLWWLKMLFFPNLCSPLNEKNYIEDLLVISDQPDIDEDLFSANTRGQHKQFFSSYLTRDGMFVIRLLHANVNPNTVGDIVAGLKRQWYRDMRETSSIFRNS